MTTRPATKQEVIRISGKNLGAFALPDACERCLWTKVRMQHRMPFTFFPGIFSSIDSYSKRIVHDHFDQHGRPPKWLEPIGELMDYREPPHWSRFQIQDETYRILLTGAPDGVFELRDGSLVIAGYKTARHTDAQDALRPMYEVQLNAYASIAEAIGMGTVSRLAGRLDVFQNLDQRVPVDAEPPAHAPLALTFDEDESSNLCPLLHVRKHPCSLRSLQATQESCESQM